VKFLLKRCRKGATSLEPEQGKSADTNNFFPADRGKSPVIGKNERTRSLEEPVNYPQIPRR
jgi:hypothetical protein